MGRPMCTSQDFVNWVCSGRLSSKFLRYVLVSEHESMGRFASGTTHQTIYYPEAKAFHVCLPPLDEQIAIAEFLESFDKRIENLEMPEELWLEGTFHEREPDIFHYWFRSYEDASEKELSSLWILTFFDRRTFIAVVDKADRTTARTVSGVGGLG